jgi:hypothetical protein
MFRMRRRQCDDALLQGHMLLFPDYLCFDSRLIAHETTITIPYSALLEVNLL